MPAGGACRDCADVSEIYFLEGFSIIIALELLLDCSEHSKQSLYLLEVMNTEKHSSVRGLLLKNNLSFHGVGGVTALEGT